MSTFTQATTSGHGSHAFGAPVTVDYVYSQLVTQSDMVSWAGFSPVRRVHRLAWYGFGFAATGIYTAYLNWGRWIEFEAQAWEGGDLPTPFADTFFWDIQTGGVMYLEVGFH